MTTFAIDTDNTITAYAAGDAIPEEQARFTSEKEFAKLAATWPTDRLVEVWNSFAGAPPFGDLKPVKKFSSKDPGSFIRNSGSSLKQVNVPILYLPR